MVKRFSQAHKAFASLGFDARWRSRLAGAQEEARKPTRRP